MMMGEMVIAKPLLVLIEELLKAMVNLGEASYHFNGVVEDIRSNLNSIASVMQKLNENSDFLNFPENTNNLTEHINKGRQLILKCDAVKRSCILKYLTASFYTKKLQDFDATLQRSSHSLSLQLIVELMKRQQEQLVLLNNNNKKCECMLHCIVEKVKEMLKRMFGIDRCRQIGYKTAYAATAQPTGSGSGWLPLLLYNHNQGIKGVYCIPTFTI